VLILTTAKLFQHYLSLAQEGFPDVGINDVARYFASIRVTTDKAESWRAWATAYIDMELEEHPTSTHACGEDGTSTQGEFGGGPSSETGSRSRRESKCMGGSGESESVCV